MHKRTWLRAVTYLAVLAVLGGTGGVLPGVNASSGRISQPVLSVDPPTGSVGATHQVVIAGSGFAPGGMVVVAFNAPMSKDGSPLTPRSIPPAVDRPGDNRP